MKVLVTGASGQLGRALMASVPPGVDIVPVGRAQLDLADAAAVERHLEAARPDLVISSGAYTAVDKAESEREVAFAVNALAPGAMARACARLGARIIQVSTDFVFDGRTGTPYMPDSATNPLSVYGASKLEGERQVSAVPGLNWMIVRTAWVYAATGRNFALTMLRLFRERQQVSVVADQVGSPTSARNLAHCLWRAAQSAEGGPAVLHYTDSGVASWYDFAIAIHDEALALGLIARPVEILPIGTDQYPTPARRPPYSVLDKRSTLARLQLAPVHWRAALRDVLKEMLT